MSVVGGRGEGASAISSHHGSSEKQNQYLLANTFKVP
jgi:hypothetical protein